jgi:hypothetical protein
MLLAAVACQLMSVAMPVLGVPSTGAGDFFPLLILLLPYMFGGKV